MKKLLFGLALSILLLSSFSPSYSLAEEHPAATSIKP